MVSQVSLPSPLVGLTMKRRRNGREVICAEAPDLWQVTVRIDGRVHDLLGLFASETLARKVGENFLRQKAKDHLKAPLS